MRNTKTSREASKYGHDSIEGSIFSIEELGSYDKEGKPEPRIRFVVSVDVTDEPGEVAGAKVKDDKWKTIYYSCTAFGPRAEYIAKSLKKNDLVSIKGTEDFKDGKYFNMTVSSIKKNVERSGNGTEAAESEKSAAPKNSSKKESTTPPPAKGDSTTVTFEEGEDEDIPF